MTLLLFILEMRWAPLLDSNFLGSAAAIAMRVPWPDEKL